MSFLGTEWLRDLMGQKSLPAEVDHYYGDVFAICSTSCSPSTSCIWVQCDQLDPGSSQCVFPAWCHIFSSKAPLFSKLLLVSYLTVAMWKAANMLSFHVVSGRRRILTAYALMSAKLWLAWNLASREHEHTMLPVTNKVPTATNEDDGFELISEPCVCIYGHTHTKQMVQGQLGVKPNTKS